MVDVPERDPLIPLSPPSRVPPRRPTATLVGSGIAVMSTVGEGGLGVGVGFFEMLGIGIKMDVTAGVAVDANIPARKDSYISGK